MLKCNFMDGRPPKLSRGRSFDRLWTRVQSCDLPGSTNLQLFLNIKTVMVTNLSLHSQGKMEFSFKILNPVS